MKTILDSTYRNSTLNPVRYEVAGDIQGYVWEGITHSNGIEIDRSYKDVRNQIQIAVVNQMGMVAIQGSYGQIIPMNPNRRFSIVEEK